MHLQQLTCLAVSLVAQPISQFVLGGYPKALSCHSLFLWGEEVVVFFTKILIVFVTLDTSLKTNLRVVSFTNACSVLENSRLRCFSLQLNNTFIE